MKTSAYYYADVDADSVNLIQGRRGPSFTTYTKSNGETYKVPSTRVFKTRGEAEALLSRTKKNQKEMAVEDQKRKENLHNYLINEKLPQNKCTDDVFGDEARERFKKDLKYYGRPSNW